MKLKTDNLGNLMEIPKLPPNKEVEAIFFIDSNDPELSMTPLRQPHPDVFENIVISDDIYDSIPESDWYSDNDRT